MTFWSIRARGRMLRVGSVVGFCADEGGEEDMPEPVNAEAGQVVIGEIELEAAFEAVDAPGQFVSVKGCY